MKWKKLYYTIDNKNIFQINSPTFIIIVFSAIEFWKIECKKNIKIKENRRNMEILWKNIIVDILLITMDMLKMLIEK